MMTKLRHPNIVRFFGIWQLKGGAKRRNTDRVFLVMEFCPNGDLQNAAQDPKSSLKQRQQWIMQVASAMKYLHGRTPPVVHRDLKPENVLLNEHFVAKIADFGISREAATRRATTGLSAAGDGYLISVPSMQEECVSS